MAIKRDSAQRPAGTPRPLRGIEKAATGIAGLDQVTGGGLPRGRPTLVCGGAGSGKTLLAMEFVVRGARELGESGVFVSFEEPAHELADNVASLGFDLRALEEDGKLRVEAIRVRREEIEESGSYDLEGLFVRLGWAIDQVGARRVALDTIEALFAGLRDHGVLRAELRRLFDWLSERGITAVITTERGEGTLTRHGLEEYVSDCVLLLDHRVDEEVSTRRLRVVKYRGSAHGTNEYPFLLDRDGFHVLPLTSLGLDHKAPEERVSTGVADLDGLLGGGWLRGSSVLISGAPGTGKTSFAAAMIAAACACGETCLLCTFEEAPRQILRNLRSVGIDLEACVEAGRLVIDAARPTTYGIESHLARILSTMDDVRPSLVAVDPMSALASGSTRHSAGNLLMRLIDHMKSAVVTGVYTSPSPIEADLASAPLMVSSLIDSWLALSDRERNGERRRELRIVKARGMAHSLRAHGFTLGEGGILLETGAGSAEATLPEENLD